MDTCCCPPGVRVPPDGLKVAPTLLRAVQCIFPVDLASSVKVTVHGADVPQVLESKLIGLTDQIRVIIGDGDGDGEAMATAMAMAMAMATATATATAMAMAMAMVTATATATVTAMAMAMAMATVTATAMATAMAMAMDQGLALDQLRGLEWLYSSMIHERDLHLR